MRFFNLRFAGQYYDTESGLSYNINRMYDGDAKRYMQSDPMGLMAGWNTYNYVGRNPLNNIDPLGLSERDVENIQNIFGIIVPQMTEDGLRKTNGYINNAKRYWDILSYGSRKNKLMDCGEQTEYMNEQLRKKVKSFDDNWNFMLMSGTSHAWGVAISSNPTDPVIWYDTRANDISIGKPCQTCIGIFGETYDTWIKTPGLLNFDNKYNPNTILESYHPYKKGN